MSRDAVARLLPDGSFRVAIYAGVAAIPVIAVLHWFSAPNPAYGVPVFLAGVLGGYVYDERPIESRRAGLGCGLATALPIATWLSVSIPYQAWTGSSGFRAITALTVGAVVLNVVFYALAGTIGGVVGGYVAWNVGRRRRGSRADSSP